MNDILEIFASGFPQWGVSPGIGLVVIDALFGEENANALGVAIGSSQPHPGLPPAVLQVQIHIWVTQQDLDDLGLTSPAGNMEDGVADGVAGVAGGVDKEVDAEFGVLIEGGDEGGDVTGGGRGREGLDPVD
jgi:hypothetical protein